MQLRRQQRRGRRLGRKEKGGQRGRKKGVGEAYGGSKEMKVKTLISEIAGDAASCVCLWSLSAFFPFSCSIVFGLFQCVIVFVAHTFPPVASSQIQAILFIAEMSPLSANHKKS